MCPRVYSLVSGSAQMPRKKAVREGIASSDLFLAHNLLKGLQISHSALLSKDVTWGELVMLTLPTDLIGCFYVLLI